VIEETDPVMEMQLAQRDRIKGRMDNSIPPQGELIPDVLEECIRKFAGKARETKPAPAGRPRRPTLCPGCPHRACFLCIRQTFPNGIYPSDIGCYTLGLNLGAVDTVLCMGATISQAAGFYHAYRMKGEFPPIVATIGIPLSTMPASRRWSMRCTTERNSFWSFWTFHHRHDRQSTNPGNGSIGGWPAGKGRFHGGSGQSQRSGIPLRR